MKISLIAIAFVAASPSIILAVAGQRSQLRGGGVLAKTLRHLVHGPIPATHLRPDEVEELAEVEDQDDVHGTTDPESSGGENGTAAKSSKNNADLDESEEEPLMEEPEEELEPVPVEEESDMIDPMPKEPETPLENEPEADSPKVGAVQEEPGMPVDPEEEVEEPETPAENASSLDEKSGKGDNAAEPAKEEPETSTGTEPLLPKESVDAKGKSQKTTLSSSDKDNESALADETVVMEDEVGGFSDAPSDVPSMAPTTGLGDFSDAPSDVPSVAPAAMAR
jgi:hypothetical protein